MASPTITAPLVHPPSGLESSPVNSTSEAPQKGFLGFRTVHWSTVLLGGAAIIGVIVAIAAAILSNNAILAGSLFFGVVCAVGAYYTHTFSKYKSLETYVLTLEDQIASFKVVIKQTEQTTEEIKETTEELERIKKERSEEAKALNESLSQNARELDSLRKKSVKAELKFKEQLDSSEKKLIENTANLEAVQQDLDQTTVTLSQEINEFKTEISRLEEQNKKLNLEVDEQIKLNTDYKSLTTQYDQENKELQEHIIQLQAMESCVDTSKVTDATRELTLELQKAQRVALEANEKMKKQEEKYLKLLARVQNLEQNN